MISKYTTWLREWLFVSKDISEEGFNILLQMQVEELTARLSASEEAHRKASQRATAAERRNSALRTKMESCEGDIRILAQCWACEALGKKEQCKKCSNSAVFIETEDGFVWRGLGKKC